MRFAVTLKGLERLRRRLARIAEAVPRAGRRR